MIRFLRSSALVSVVPFLAIVALIYHSLLFLISFLTRLVGVEIAWPPVLVDDLEAEARGLPPSPSSSGTRTLA